MNLTERIRAFTGLYQTTGWIVVLMLGGLALQLILWLVMALVGADEGVGLYKSIIDHLVLPGNGGKFIRQPWSLFTYPFFYQSSGASFPFFSVLFDGLWIWLFGRIHQQLLGDTRTRRLSILVIPIIGILTVLICSFVPVFGQTNVLAVSGISPLMITLMVSSITLVPDYPIQLFLFGRVKILWIGLVLLAFELAFSFVTPMGVAILCAAILGYLHVYFLRKGSDITELVWSYYQDSGKAARPKMKVKYGTKKREEYPKQKKFKEKDGDIPQEIIDGILDKISAKGYDSLTREEKEMLFKASSQTEDDKKD